MRGAGFPRHAKDTELRGLCKALEFCVPLKTNSPCQLSMIVSRLAVFVDVKPFFFYALVYAGGPMVESTILNRMKVMTALNTIDTTVATI